MLKKNIFIVLQYINGEYNYIWKAGIQESFSWSVIMQTQTFGSEEPFCYCLSNIMARIVSELVIHAASPRALLLPLPFSLHSSSLCRVRHLLPNCSSQYGNGYILASDQEHKTLTSWMPTLLNTVLDISHIFVIPCKGRNDSDKKIILCCRSGKRGSERLNSFLTQLSQSSISKTGYSYYKALFL